MSDYFLLWCVREYLQSSPKLLKNTKRNFGLVECWITVPLSETIDERIPIWFGAFQADIAFTKHFVRDQYSINYKTRLKIDGF